MVVSSLSHFGELTIFVGDTELTLKPAQVQRLRRLLGGGV